MSEATLTTAGRVGKALSHPTRLKVACLLQKKPMTHGELARRLNEDRGSLHRHLTVLVKARLIEKFLDTDQPGVWYRAKAPEVIFDFKDTP